MTDFNIKSITDEEIAEAESSYKKWLEENPNNFSFWFPKVSEAIPEGKFDVSIPKSMIIPVPYEIVKCIFMENETDEETIMSWIRQEKISERIKEFADGDSILFMKNGCFSDKFDFDNACRLTRFDDDTIFSHFLRINQDSMMCGFNGAGGNTELIIRKYIPESPKSSYIYHGIPMRPEVRVFYDFTKQILHYDVFYWDRLYCLDKIYDKEDKKTFKKVNRKLEDEYKRLFEQHKTQIMLALREVNDLEGVWSVDFILEEDKVWLIDMAIGSQSAYYEQNYIDKFGSKVSEYSYCKHHGQLANQGITFCNAGGDPTDCENCKIKEIVNSVNISSWAST